MYDDDDDGGGDIKCDRRGRDATVQEDRVDRNTFKKVKRRLEALLPGRATVHVDEAVWWRDRVRAPVSFEVATRLQRAHFEACAAAGGELVVEEEFSETQMCAFYCEIPRCTIRGFRAWPHHMSADSSSPDDGRKNDEKTTTTPSSLAPPPPPPHDVRMAARAVMVAFGTAVNRWGYLKKKNGWLLAFHVPPNTPVRSRHFAAVRTHRRAASAWVQWKEDHMRFVVKLPKDRKRRISSGIATADSGEDDGGGAVAPESRKRRRVEKNVGSAGQ